MKTPSGYTHVEDAHGVSSYVLDSNGLKVLVAPRHDFPVIGTMVTYHVGSRHEQPGHTGATHILEHVMFKGSKHYDPKKGKGTWQLLEKKGSQGNATTWCDRTNYYWVSPMALFKDALAIEADRMRNILLRPEDLASEMTVVRNEYESGENDPYQRMAKQAGYLAFTVHPYRIPTIGTKEDIEGVTVEKLKKFYDTFYWPNNATVTIAGDVSVEDALAEVKIAFGGVPKHEITEPPFEHEPVQEGERRFDLKRKGTVNAVLFSFKAPAGLAEDALALSLAKTLLANGKSSSLHKALVDTGIATDISADFPRFRDPSLLELFVALPEGVPHEKAEAKVMEVLEYLASHGPTDEELTRAVNYAVAEKKIGMSSVSGILGSLNEAIARGDWKDGYDRIEKTERVTATDVMRAAKTYLNRDKLTVGYLYAE